jgi:hypothetical protein
MDMAAYKAQSQGGKGCKRMRRARYVARSQTRMAHKPVLPLMVRAVFACCGFRAAMLLVIIFQVENSRPVHSPYALFLMCVHVHARRHPPSAAYSS